MKQRKLHRDPQREDRFQEILAASLRLFAKHGYEKTSIDRIAKEIHATKGLVYYYFRSKEQILKAMVEAYDFTPAIAQIGAIDLNVPLPEALSLLIRGSISVLDSRVEYVRFLYTEGQFLDRQSELLMRRILEEWTDRVATFLRTRVEQREMAAHDTQLAAHQLTDAVLAFFLKTRVIDPALAQKLPGREYFEQWIQTFLHGVAPARPTNRPHDLPTSRIFALLRKAEGITPEVLFGLAPALFRESEVAGLVARIHVHLLGETPLHYSVEISNRKLQIQPGRLFPPDLEIELHRDDLIGLARGECKAAHLYLSERIRITGSIDLARRVGRAFAVPSSVEP